MKLLPYYYLVIVPVSISCIASYLSISSNTKTIINLIAALLVIISIPLNYREYKKLKQESK